MTDLTRHNPAASAYGDLRRAQRSGVDPYAREAARVRILLACGSRIPAPTDADEREVRRAHAERFRL